MNSTTLPTPPPPCSFHTHSGAVRLELLCLPRPAPTNHKFTSDFLNVKLKDTLQSSSCWTSLRYVILLISFLKAAHLWVSQLLFSLHPPRFSLSFLSNLRFSWTCPFNIRAHRTCSSASGVPPCWVTASSPTVGSVLVTHRRVSTVSTSPQSFCLCFQLPAKHFLLNFPS